MSRVRDLLWVVWLVAFVGALAPVALGVAAALAVVEAVWGL